MNPSHPFLASCEEMLQQELPNLFRLYLNPYVTQACFCLEQYVQTTWKHPSACQTFLANAFDEALGGAIKLARYDASLNSRPAQGLVVDSADRLGPFAWVSLAGGEKIEFVPGLTIAGRDSHVRAAAQAGTPFGLIVLVVTPEGNLGIDEEVVRRILGRDAPRVIVCVDRAGLAALRKIEAGLLRELVPDIVVFDETFVNRDVPFSAFTGGQTLFDHWNQPGKTTFHSTTYQPNTVASLHLLRCLTKADPEFHGRLAGDLARIDSDLSVRMALFRRLYSPSLGKAIRGSGFDVPNVRAVGASIVVGQRRIFDGVSGVACSVRGHNPPNFTHELKELAEVPDVASELGARLRELTGLECDIPAVSGATAVENALKLALVAQFPRRHVLALRSGFGGKTLFALTGTWNNTYKQNIGPLYADVVYVDPFAPDAIAQIDQALAAHSVAVVQVELIQAVGGVRAVPEDVLRHLHACRLESGYLLLIDEVQTGVFRTGPFIRSRAMNLSPDLLVLGKGTSDMMVPFALVMYSAAVQARLDAVGSDLPLVLRNRYGYPFGYLTVLNMLRQADKLDLARRVSETGELFAQLLIEELGNCRAVRQVRVYGLLIGIELETRGGLRRWLRRKLYLLCILAMLRHPRFPVLVGYCQYEPHVLKFTPPLTVEPEQVRSACATIGEVLRRPLYRLLATALFGLGKSIYRRRPKHEHGHRVERPAHEPVQR